MKINKLNAALGAIVATLISTAYATCYLQGVVLCFEDSDTVSSDWCFGTTYTFGSTSSPSTGCSGYTAAVIADENAYRWDLMSASRGGKNHESSLDRTSYCDGASTGNGVLTGFNNYNQGFRCRWFNPNLGTQVTGMNAPSPGTAFATYAVSSLDNSATDCN